MSKAIFFSANIKFQLHFQLKLILMNPASFVELLRWPLIPSSEFDVVSLTGPVCLHDALSLTNTEIHV